MPFDLPTTIGHIHAPPRWAEHYSHYGTICVIDFSASVFVFERMGARVVAITDPFGNGNTVGVDADHLLVFLYKKEGAEGNMRPHNYGNI